MKAKKRIYAILLTIAMSLALCVPALAVTQEYQSGRITVTVGDKEYILYSILYKDSTNTYRTSAWAEVADKSYVPAEYIGVDAWFCTGKNQILYSTGFKYNDVPYPFWYAVSEKQYSTAAVYASGEVDLYSGTRHEYKEVPQTQKVGGTRAAAEENTAIKSFPVNQNGDTYGDVKMAEMIGYKPDLIAAVGNDGVEGYLKISDMRPQITCKADILAYYEKLEENPNIPLYDVNGNVIGTFTISADAGEDIKAFATSIDEVKAAIRNSMEEILGTEEIIEQAKVKIANMADDTSPIYHAPTVGEPLSMELADDEYPVADGLSYGTMAQASIVGEPPDLVSVIATNGQQGWVTLKEFSPIRYLAKHGASTEEVNAFINKAMNQNSSVLRYIPVYDLDMNVIGEFPTGYAITPRG